MCVQCRNKHYMYMLYHVQVHTQTNKVQTMHTDQVYIQVDTERVNHVE